MGRVDSVDLALDWLAHSDIRCADSTEQARGGVKQGYNWRERSYPFVYSEITGYAISTFVNAHRWTGDEGYVILARQSADFLMYVQQLSSGEAVRGAIPHSLSLPDLEPQHSYYSFDAAMCLQGLLDMDSVKPARELRRSAQAIGDWLVDRMQQDSGAFLALGNGSSNVGADVIAGDFGDGGCLHAKHAIGLLKLSGITGVERYTAAARRVCDWVLSLQDTDGAFRATERLRRVVSHSHCYATEGLLFAHRVLGEERYLDAARRAGEWLLGAQNCDGSVNIAYKRDWWRMGRRMIEEILPRRVTDATAQAIRIWLILDYLHDDRRFLDACHRGKRFLEETQCRHSADRNAVGGFSFWPGHPMMYAWCTMFAANGLYALKHVERKQGYRHTVTELF